MNSRVPYSQIVHLHTSRMGQLSHLLESPKIKRTEDIIQVRLQNLELWMNQKTNSTWVFPAFKICLFINFTMSMSYLLDAGSETQVKVDVQAPSKQYQIRSSHSIRMHLLWLWAIASSCTVQITEVRGGIQQQTIKFQFVLFDKIGSTYFSHIVLYYPFSEIVCYILQDMTWKKRWVKSRLALGSLRRLLLCARDLRPPSGMMRIPSNTVQPWDHWFWRHHHHEYHLICEWL